MKKEPRQPRWWILAWPGHGQAIFETPVQARLMRMELYRRHGFAFLRHADRRHARDRVWIAAALEKMLP